MKPSSAITMRPVFLHPNRFEAVVTDKEEYTFLLPRTKYLIRWWDGFCLRDSNGDLWRPCKPHYMCDLSSVPHPFTLLPCFMPTRYQRSAALHDYACRYGMLSIFDKRLGKWIDVHVSRATADRLIMEGIQAEGAWRITQGAYYGGVRIGSGFAAAKDFIGL